MYFFCFWFLRPLSVTKIPTFFKLIPKMYIYRQNFFISFSTFSRKGTPFGENRKLKKLKISFLLSKLESWYKEQKWSPRWADLDHIHCWPVLKKWSLENGWNLFWAPGALTRHTIVKSVTFIFLWNSRQYCEHKLFLFKVVAQIWRKIWIFKCFWGLLKILGLDFLKFLTHIENH